MLAVADKILLLADGTVRAFGPRDDVLAHLQKANQQNAAATQAAAQPQAAPTATLPAPGESA